MDIPMTETTNSHVSHLNSNLKDNLGFSVGLKRCFMTCLAVDFPLQSFRPDNCMHYTTLEENKTCVVAAK